MVQPSSASRLVLHPAASAGGGVAAGGAPASFAAAEATAAGANPPSGAGETLKEAVARRPHLVSSPFMLVHAPVASVGAALLGVIVSVSTLDAPETRPDEMLPDEPQQDRSFQRMARTYITFSGLIMGGGRLGDRDILSIASFTKPNDLSGGGLTLTMTCDDEDGAPVPAVSRSASRMLASSPPCCGLGGSTARWQARRAEASDRNELPDDRMRRVGECRSSD